MTPHAGLDRSHLPAFREQIRALRQAVAQRRERETEAATVHAQAQAHLDTEQQQAGELAEQTRETTHVAIEVQLERIAQARAQMVEVLRAAEIVWNPPPISPVPERRVRSPRTLETLTALAALAEIQPTRVQRMNPWSARPYFALFLLIGGVVFLLIGLGIAGYQRGQEGVGVFLALCGAVVGLGVTLRFGIAASTAGGEDYRLPVALASLGALVVFVLVGFFHERWTEAWFLVSLGPAVLAGLLPLLFGIALGEYSRTAALFRARRVVATEAQAQGLALLLRTQAEHDYQTQMEQLATQQAEQLSHAEQVRQATLEDTRTFWQQALQEVERNLLSLATECQERCTGTSPAETSAFALPRELRLGEMTLDLDHLPDGRSAEPILVTVPWSNPVVPALVEFPHLSLLIRCGEQSKALATRCVQAYLFRLLTSLPPGKVRFTFFDPTGLGENFAAFMHLGDHDETLVTSRVWTEPRQIEEQLARVTEHMAEVIQKYLRGQYRTIDEYNAQAGEVAEPYRFIVVAGFPAAFSATAAARLLSIASVGPRCGVYVILTLDTALSLPPDFNLRELEQTCSRLRWNGSAFHWDDPDFGPWPIRCDEPPGPQRLAVLLNQIGRQAVEGSQVRVPFDFVVPAPEDRWKADSRDGLIVPVGRAGATKRQCFCLGQGTAQHALVAGRTGSGKSTFLHALILNLALSYAPDEVELYLVDFKKGVEFKTYATHQLPHARVVAIESEREFGLSVLQRLDQELQMRGDAFRELGVQDIANYRRVRPQARMPRALLIVDEFQELFVENDRIAEEAGLLLDRLVRQGRAFGLHVVLGSQTLGGAATLPRTTTDQMAVRVALQCSDADARLILSENNTAAGLLSRPGEAIYNDANGREEGNSLFQVVWLAEQHREPLLATIRCLAEEAGYAPPRPCVVFEGNVPADLSRNHLLPRGPDDVPARSSRVWRVWLGESVAIKDPTHAVFRPQSASHLLIVGQQADLALGIVQAVLVGIGLQHRHGEPPGGQVFLFDGTPADSPRIGQLHDLAALLPCPVQEVDRRRVSATLCEIRSRVEERLTAEHPNWSALFVVLHGIPSFRELRDSDTRGDLIRILREGPVVSVHVVLWCDTLINLLRTVEETTLQEFEMRVVLQMSQQDSLRLIESPAASNLGTSRALFFHEERGTAEKFRPYHPIEDRTRSRLENLLAK